MTGQPDPELGAAIARAVGSDETRPLTRYIRDNLAKIRSERERGVAWKAIAQAIAARGILDTNGKPPTFDAVRAAYGRVNDATPAKPQPVGRPRQERAAAPHPTKAWE